MPLNFIGTIPQTLPEMLIYIIAGIGAVLLIYSVFLEQVHRKDLVQLLGACCLLSYAIYANQKIFMLAMGGIAIASVIEFLEIYLGLHHHAQDDLKKYKKMWRKNSK